MTSRTYEDILTDMKNLMIANQSQITDFNDGSVISTLFESIARILEIAYIDTRNGYTSNLRAIPYSMFGFTKKEGEKATCNVKFTINSATTDTISIPVDTVVSDGTYRFKTTSTASVSVGETESNEVGCQAEEIGESYNLSIGSINTIESTVNDKVVSVTNTTAGIGGSDDETSTEMLSRFKDYINGLQGSNIYGLKSGVLALSGVRSVGIVEHFPPRDDKYNLTIYVDDGSGGLNDNLEYEVDLAVNGDRTAENPGLRAAGLWVDIQAATQIPIRLKCKVKVYRTNATFAKTNIISTIKEFFNSLKIHEDFVITDLILKLRRISYVTDVYDLTVSVSGGTESTNNVGISESQIAKLVESSLDTDIEVVVSE